MTANSHLVLTTIVTRTQWTADRLEVLRSARATLQQRAQQQNLELLDEPVEDIEVLPGGTRVRITLSTQTAPAQSGRSSSPLHTPTQNV
jgi:hypothetical protein